MHSPAPSGKHLFHGCPCRCGTGTLMCHVANALLLFRTIQMYPLIYYTATAEFGGSVLALQCMCSVDRFSHYTVVTLCATPSIPASSARRKKLALKPSFPPDFSGDRAAGKAFLTSCQTYIRLCPEAFEDDLTKMIWAMSYMKTGRANRWATREFEQEAKASHLRFIDWLDFEEEFRKDFMPLDSESATINVLETTAYFQGKRTVDDYLDRDYGPRACSVLSAEIIEHREKHRIVVYPAGIHISDFSCLWELMAAFMDVVIGMYFPESKQTIHRDISYTNVLLRTLGPDSQEKKEWQAKITETFGLSEIENLQAQYSSQEGLLIDFDYASRLAQSENMEESENTTSVDKHPGNAGDGPSVGTQPVQCSDTNKGNCQRGSGIHTVRLF